MFFFFLSFFIFGVFFGLGGIWETYFAFEGFVFLAFGGGCSPLFFLRLHRSARSRKVEGSRAASFWP